MAADEEIKAFVEDRNRMLGSEDEEDWRAYYRKWDIPLPSDHLLFLVSVHKARTAIKGLAIEKRRASKAWLNARGYHALDDGEV